VERAEEYLEAILDIQEREKRMVRTGDLAKRLNVKPSSVSEMLLKLSKKGYVEYQPYRGVVLTKKGREVAEKIKKYYNIFRIFFRDFLGIEKEEAERLSCEVEHHVNDEVVKRVCMIIAGKCNICEECEYKVITLSDADDGEYIVLACPSAVEKVGIKPNKKVRVFESKVFVDSEGILISEELARKIILKRA